MKSMPCGRCDARCCRTFLVPLNGADIIRLSRHLAVPIGEWCVLEPISDATTEYTYFSIRLTGEERYIPCLNRENGSCIFLQRSSLRAGCGIYEARPGMCRSYPITFSSGKAEYMDGCICPERWQLEPADESAFSELYMQYNAHFADYKEITDLWEQTSRQEYILTGQLTGDHAADEALFLNFLTRRLTTA
ncbi:MAG TPA: YkgJ family cysteine cluster protein [Candidatus Ozemobacteraceae bacterium]|nr:YkgJ family cysteine cluster protein [Candidatus Ozemobacteraceae bacterium]